MKTIGYFFGLLLLPVASTPGSYTTCTEYAKVDSLRQEVYIKTITLERVNDTLDSVAKR